MKQIYINSLQIHDYQDNSLGMVVSPQIQGLESPGVRLPAFDRPNVDGSIVPNQLYSSRLITLTGTVFADSVTDYQTRRTNLAKAIAISRTTAGDLQNLTLKMVTDDGRELQVDCYTKNFTFPVDNLMHGKYKLDLLAPSIYIFGQELKNSDIFIFQGGGFSVPFAIPFDMDEAGSSLTDINNAGNITSYPFYVLRGPLQNPVFSNITTGEQFSVTCNLTAGQLVEIDSLKHTVVYRAFAGDTPVNYVNNFSGTYAGLVSGHNYCKLSNADFTKTGLISVQYRDAYSGI